MAAEPEAYGDRLALAADEMARLTTRLRRLSRAAWASRRAPVVDLLHRLAEVERDAAGSRRLAMPSVPDHALGDAVMAVGSDALDALAEHPDDARLAAVLSALRLTSEATR